MAEQARALAHAGARVTLFCYGHGEPEDASAAASERGLREAGVRLRRAPALLTRTPLRAGPSAGKPLADAALLGTLLAAARGAAFDAILAHNAEAGLVALAARTLVGVPTIYVAHTLLRHELPSYGPSFAGGLVGAAGARIDAFLASSSDAVIALARSAETALSAHARGPVAWIPPALDPQPAPSEAAIGAACARAGLAPGGFVLYAGNLDAYQELDLLADAARRMAKERGRAALPIVVATHDPKRTAPEPLRVVRVGSAADARVLTFGAAVAVLARRSPGGFPVKLLNYMEAGRAIIGFAGVTEGLLHGREAWLLPPQAGAEGLARTLSELASMPAVAAQLGGAARRRLLRAHGTTTLAERTLALVEEARLRAGGARSAATVLRGGG